MLHTRTPAPTKPKHAEPAPRPLEYAADDITRLTSELDAVLKHRVTASPGSMSASEAAHNSGMPTRAPGHAAPPDQWADDADDFAWICAELEPGTRPVRTGAERAKQWVRKARRERFKNQLRNLGAWILTFGVIGGALTVATFLMLGELPDPSHLGLLLYDLVT
jgi:hypothetical protein